MIPGESEVTLDTVAVPSGCCVISGILARIGDKWSVIIVMLLAAGPMRFSELRRAIAGISQRMLTLSLRGLEREGLVSRTVTPSIPPRVDYALTDLGHSLVAPVRALGNWAVVNHDAVLAAREDYDGRAAQAA